MSLKQNIDLGALGKPFGGLQKLHLERLNPWVLIGVGFVLLAILSGLLFLGGGSQKGNEESLEQARQTISQVSGTMVSNMLVCHEAKEGPDNKHEETNRHQKEHHRQGQLIQEAAILVKDIRSGFHIA